MGIVRRAAVWTDSQEHCSQDPGDRGGQGASRARPQQQEQKCKWGLLREEAAEGPSRGMLCSDLAFFKHPGD